MQELRTETTQFLADLQSSAGRQLHYPREVGQLVDLAHERHLEQVFRDAIFQAKFAVKSKEIMARIGTGGEGFDKLSAEFRNSVEKASALLRTIVKESPDELKQHFVGDFFGLDQGSFANFVRLLEDLGWVKNWEVDGKPFPFDAGRAEETVRNNAGGDSFARIRMSSVLGLILMIVLLMADPPVSFLGWAAAILVCFLLFFIAVASGTKSKT